MPYLRHYAYLRQAENMATSAPQMKPPREDLYAPDLYVPLHAMCTYVVLSAWNRFFAGPFAPEVMYNMVRTPRHAAVWSACGCSISLHGRAGCMMG